MIKDCVCIRDEGWLKHYEGEAQSVSCQIREIADNHELCETGRLELLAMMCAHLIHSLGDARAVLKPKPTFERVDWMLARMRRNLN